MDSDLYICTYIQERFTAMIFEFPRYMYDLNSRSMLLAATVRIHGATFVAVPAKALFPADAETRIPF